MTTLEIVLLVALILILAGGIWINPWILVALLVVVGLLVFSRRGTRL